MTKKINYQPILNLQIFFDKNEDGVFTERLKFGDFDVSDFANDFEDKSFNELFLAKIKKFIKEKVEDYSNKPELDWSDFN